MPTLKLCKPPGMEFHPVGSGYVFGDGTVMRAQPDGCFYLPESHGHYLSALLNKGWRIWEPEKPKPVYKDALDRLVHEMPLGAMEIMRQCAAENVLLRREGKKLQVRPLTGLRLELQRYIECNASAILNELDRRQTVQWETVE